MSEKQDPEQTVREIKLKSRRKSSAEEKICIALQGLKGKETIASSPKNGVQLSVLSIRGRLPLTQGLKLSACCGQETETY